MQKKYYNRILIGMFNSNPILYTYINKIELNYNTQTKYTNKVLLENLYDQIDYYRLIFLLINNIIE